MTKTKGKRKRREQETMTHTHAHADTRYGKRMPNAKPSKASNTPKDEEGYYDSSEAEECLQENGTRIWKECRVLTEFPQCVSSSRAMGYLSTCEGAPLARPTADVRSPRQSPVQTRRQSPVRSFRQSPVDGEEYMEEVD